MVASDLQAVEAALDSVPHDPGLERAHLYFELRNRDDVEEVVRGLMAEGFMVVRALGQRYDYKDRAWTWQAELALGGVGVYLKAVT